MKEFVRGNDDFHVGPCWHEQVAHFRLEPAQNVREAEGDFAGSHLRTNERKRQ